MGGEKRNCRQDKEGGQNEVRQRAKRKPRRSHQEAEPENGNYNSFFPFFSRASQKTGEHRQQRDARVGQPTSGGNRLGSHAIEIPASNLTSPRQTVVVRDPPYIRSLTDSKTRQDIQAAILVRLSLCQLRLALRGFRPERMKTADVCVCMVTWFVSAFCHRRLRLGRALLRCVKADCILPLYPSGSGNRF